jgi:hypothetical protein
LYQLGWIAEQLSTFREILLAVVARSLVRRVREFDHGHELAALPVLHLQERLFLDVLLGQPDFRWGFE